MLVGALLLVSFTVAYPDEGYNTTMQWVKSSYELASYCRSPRMLRIGPLTNPRRDFHRRY